MTYDRDMLMASWLMLVYRKADEVDPDQERDWFDLAYGFALGKGLVPDDAFDFANSLGPGEI